jgi:hypothetical protein
MNIIKFTFLTLLFPVLTMLYSYKGFKPCKSQGIKGYVYIVKGNQMPSPGIKPAPPKGYSTTVCIYELTNINQVKKASNSPFYSSIQAKLIKEIRSGKDGSFKVALKKGQYSLFVKVVVKKDTFFYANRLDGKSNIFPVKVDDCKFTEVVFKADYDAVY